MTATNNAPDYIKRVGGASWLLTATCGTNASALRDDAGSDWNVFDCDNADPRLLVDSAWMTDTQILNLLVDIIREAIVKGLADVNETMFV